jgi:hypothetical protein
MFMTKEGSRASFYFSDTGDRFIFLVTDIHGDGQSLDLTTGDNGVPLGKFVFITCQAGLNTNQTYLRVLINEREVMEKTLPFRMDLGSRRWEKGILGADNLGKHGSAFEALAIEAMGHVTLTDSQITSIINRVQTYLKDTGSPLGLYK